MWEGESQQSFIKTKWKEPDFLLGNGLDRMAVVVVVVVVDTKRRESTIRLPFLTKWQMELQ